MSRQTGIAGCGAMGFGGARMPPGAWLAMSDSNEPLAPPLPEHLASALMVMDLAWPLPSDVLLAWDDRAGHALSLFHDARAGLALVLRIAGKAQRLRLPGPLRLTGSSARLLLRWDVALARWSLRLEEMDGTERALASGWLDQPVPGPMLAALFGAGSRALIRRDAAILWFGLTPGNRPPPGESWIGRNTPILTPEGTVPAALLKPGQMILTRDAGPMRLQSLRHMRLPAHGDQAAVILRAPWHAHSHDLLVSADQMLMVAGQEVEYLLDEEAVLVPAGSFAGSPSGVTDPRRALVAGVSLDLGGPHLIEADGCLLLSAHHGSAESRHLPALRMLKTWEGRPLAGALRRGKAA